MHFMIIIIAAARHYNNAAANNVAYTQMQKQNITVSHLADNSSACGGGEDQFSIDINWGYVMWVGWVVVDWQAKR